MSVSHKYNSLFTSDEDDPLNGLANILAELKIARFGWKEGTHWRIHGATTCDECGDDYAPSHIHYGEFLICADVTPAVAAEICVCIRDVRSRQRESDTKKFYENELSNMCHAIRTPLNGIFHLSDINNLLGDDDQKENLHNNLSHLRNACTTLVENLMDIVDFLKLSNNTLQFDAATFDLPAALRDCMRRASRTDIDLNISPNVPSSMYGDAMRVKQIFNGMFAYDVVSLTVDTTADICDDICVHRVKFLFEVKDDTGGLSFLVDCAANPMADPAANLGVDVTAATTEDIQARIAFRLIYMLAMRMGGSVHVRPGGVPPPGGSTYIVVIVLPLQEHAPNLPCISIAILGNDSDLAETLASSSEYNVNVNVFDIDAPSQHMDAIVVLENTCEHVEKKYSGTSARPLIVDGARARRSDEFLRDVYTHVRGRQRLLLVEDDKINCIVMKQILGKFNFEVDIATSGEDAIALIEKKEYNIYLLDIRLPGMSGQEIAKYIRDRAATKPKIIGVTAQLLECHDGFDRILYKPINISELTSALMNQ